MVLKRSVLDNNAQVVHAFLQEHHLSIAPHAKTHMSPQLIDLQLSCGAWGITAATVNQLQVLRRFGVNRIILANQLVGRQNIRYIVDEINADPDFEFYCLVDSVAGVKHLVSHVQQFVLRRPVKVLLEGGCWGGRTGCRTIEQAREVIAELRAVQQWLTLASVEGFEGVISRDTPGEAVEQVNLFMAWLIDLLAEVQPEDLSGADEIILSVGGSGYFDLVAKAFHSVEFFLPKHVVLRSGCYLTHDSHDYSQLHQQMVGRGWHGPSSNPLSKSGPASSQFPSPG